MSSDPSLFSPPAGDHGKERPIEASEPKPKSEPAPAPKRSFWQRRVRDPLVALLTRGATPEGLAKTLAWGGVCSMFPFLGTTAALNFAVGQALKLNHALMQTLNQLLGGVHLVMILLYVRIGETLWRHQGDRFSVLELIRSFRDLSFGDFMEKFGWAGVHALTAWALTAPFLYWATYAAARPALVRLARLLPAGSTLPAEKA